MTLHDPFKIIRVLVADRQRLLSSALGRSLSLEPDIVALEERPTMPREAVDAAWRLKPDVVLIDYSMDVPEIVNQILVGAPDSKVLVLSWIHGPQQVRDAISAGAVGFLPKSCGLGQVVSAVRRAREGEPLVFAEQLHRLVETIDQRHEETERFASKLRRLSPREFQILLLLGSGRLIQDVSVALNITQATVTVHINHILKKTGARSHAEVLAMARAMGLIT